MFNSFKINNNTTTSGKNYSNNANTTKLNDDHPINLTLSQLASLTTKDEKSIEDRPIFTPKQLWTIITVVALAVFTVVGIYFDFVNKIEKTDSKLTELKIDYESIQNSNTKNKDGFYDLRTEIKSIKKELETYDLKQLNNDIVKLKTQVDNLNNQLDKNTNRLNNSKIR